MKSKKAITIIVIILVVAFLVIIGRLVYQVLCISCTGPPIKTYKCLGGMDQFKTSLKNFADSNPNVVWKVTDTVGDRFSGVAYYINITLNDSTVNFTGQIRCEENPKLDVKEVQISLIGLFDNRTNLGGYNINAKGVNQLLKDFEKDFIAPFNRSKSPHINLAPAYTK